MKKYLISTVLLLWLRGTLPAQSYDSLGHRPGKTEIYQLLPFGSIRPGGWIQAEIRRNLQGFTGQLDQLAPDLLVTDDIYGKNRISRTTPPKKLGALSDGGEIQAQFLWWNSETQGNWLDGLVRSAVLAADSAALQKARHRIDYLLSTQDPDGYLGIYDTTLRYRFENENGELWSKTTLYRALLAWYEHTRDARILRAVQRATDEAMRAYPAFRSHPFYSVNPDAGGLTHGLAFTDVLEHLYRITGNAVYRRYAAFLYLDFSAQALHEDARLPVVTDTARPLMGHGVHTYEHLRSVAAAYYASPHPLLGAALSSFLQKIKRSLTPSGGPAGDEFIGGRAGDATHTGYEYCSLQELLHSWLSLYQKSGDAYYAEAAERLLYNAAMGATHPSESAICYLKTDNCRILNGGKDGDTTDRFQTRYRYSPVHREAAVCCVPNAGRVLPTFVQYQWLTSSRGPLLVMPAPGDVNLRIRNQSVQIRVITAYPFENRIRLQVHTDRPVSFVLSVRKPAGVSGIRSSVPAREHRGLLEIERRWSGTTEVELNLDREPVTCRDANGAVYFTYGPLVLCRPLEAVTRETRRFPGTSLRELSCEPLPYEELRYAGDSLRQLPGDALRFETTMQSAVNGKTKSTVLVPMFHSVLRQVTFSAQ